MNIWFKPYAKKNGEVITYVCNDRKVSFAISAAGSLPAQYGKFRWTGGQEKLISTYNMALDNLLDTPPLTTDADISKGVTVGCLTKLTRGWHLAATDIGDFCGVNCGGDGVYLIAPNGNVYPSRLKVAM